MFGYKTQPSHSQFEPATLPCRACGQPVEAEVWIIVDVDKRPDLLARLQAGALHDFVCPGCGHTATLNAPLLICRPGAEPPLLFPPAHGGDPKQHEEQATALPGLFREGVGNDEVSPDVRRTLETIIRTLAAKGLRIQTAEDLQHALTSHPELNARLAAALAK